MSEEINTYTLNKPKRMKTVIMENLVSDKVKLDVVIDQSSKVIFRASLIKEDKK